VRVSSTVVLALNIGTRRPDRTTMISDLPGFFEGTEMPNAGWWEALWPAPAKVLSSVGLTSGMDVVDLCAGDGWFTLEIAVLAHHVVAIDLDEKLLELARVRLAERGIANCDFVAGNAYDVDKLVLEPVDFVFMANAFHGVTDRLKLAHAVQTVLKPAGRFVIVNWHQRPREQTPILGEPRGPRTELRLSPDQTSEAVGRLQNVAGSRSAALSLWRCFRIRLIIYGRIIDLPRGAERLGNLKEARHEVHCFDAIR